jgi:hypothetical protein
MSNLTSNLAFLNESPKLLHPGQGSLWLKSKLVLPLVSVRQTQLQPKVSEAQNLLIKDSATNFTSLANAAVSRNFVSSVVNLHFKTVQKEVGIIVPCYNEEKRLKIDEFKSFLSQNNQHIVCFVNDGSTDNTIKTLESLRDEFGSQVIVIDCIKNLGKAGAVRAGVNYLKDKQNIKYIGFLDADLSTDFGDFLNLVDVIKASKFKIVTGSRIMRMGANIVKESSRGIISRTINLLICWILGMNFQDTQCGAKIMTKEMAEATFKKPFLTRWLFDVEVFMRMKVLYGKDQASNYICEEPLKRWVHAEDSKLGFKDSVKIVFQLLQITYTYWR